MPKTNHTANVFLLFYLIAMVACQSSPSSKDNAKQAETPKATTSQDKTVAMSLKKFFEFKSAKIDFTYSGIFEGKETYYIDDWGNTVVMVQDKKEFGHAKNQTTIWKDEQTTIHNHLEKNVWRGKLRPKDTEPPAVASIAEEQLEMVGYKKLPDEQIAGKTCTVYENSSLNVKYWLWKGIDLKIINRSVGEVGYVREATSVEENVAIPQKLLTIPEEYSVSQ